MVDQSQQIYEISKAAADKTILSKEITEILSKETAETVTLGQLKQIGQEAEKILKTLRLQRGQINKLMQMIENPNAAIYSYSKHLINYQTTLNKGYMLIQKVRKLITGEGMDYLILFDDGSESRIVRVSLEQLLPALSLSVNINSKGQVSTGLRIGNINDFGRLKGMAGEMDNMEKMLLNLYQTAMFSEGGSRRSKIVTDDGKKVKLSGGFMWETVLAEGAAMERGESKYDSQASSLERARYLAAKQERDNKAFYTVSDARADKGQIPSQYMKQDKYNLELKKLSTTSQYGNTASLAAAGTIETALIGIRNLCLNKNFSLEQIKSNLDKYIFNAEKNLRKDVAKKMAKITEEELNKLFQGLKT